MRKLTGICMAGILTLAGTATGAITPPFSGTIFIDPDIIKSTDPTVYSSVSYLGQGTRTVFDRRVDGNVTINAYLVQASFTDGTTMEVRVNPEFGSSAAALAEAQKYSRAIGLMPKALRLDMRNVIIHKGVEPFGGGGNGVLIHTGQADQYIASGILEETLMHEMSHTSLDARYRNSAGWLAAQAADPTFISTYARDNPTREDIAESYLTYFAVRWRPDRISTSLKNTIQTSIPNRIAFFDSLNLPMAPVPEPATLMLLAAGGILLTIRRRPGTRT